MAFTYGISKGHNTAYNTGASGCGHVEDDCTRDIGQRVIDKLRAMGESVVDCTPTTATSLRDSLQRRCDIAKNNGADLFVEIHLNADDNPAAHGTEVYCNPANTQGYNYAQKILNGLCNIGWTSRGVKDGNWLYVIKHTEMTGILIEVCFISNPGDMSLYGPEKIANAIVQALTGKAYTEPVRPTVETPAYDFVKLQKLIGAVPDNIPGPETLSKCPLVKIGAVSEIVRWIQNRLNSLGFDCGTADGIFGNMTLAAVKRFQGSKGLVVDGIIGQNTWRKLLGL